VWLVIKNKSVTTHGNMNVEFVANCLYLLITVPILSASVLRHLQGARACFDLCTLRLSLFGRPSTYMINYDKLNIKIIKIHFIKYKFMLSTH
jgi:hypothetical protein